MFTDILFFDENLTKLLVRRFRKEFNKGNGNQIFEMTVDAKKKKLNDHFLPLKVRSGWHRAIHMLCQQMYRESIFFNDGVSPRAVYELLIDAEEFLAILETRPVTSTKTSNKKREAFEKELSDIMKDWHGNIFGAAGAIRKRLEEKYGFVPK